MNAHNLLDVARAVFRLASPMDQRIPQQAKLWKPSLREKALVAACKPVAPDFSPRPKSPMSKSPKLCFAVLGPFCRRFCFFYFFWGVGGGGVGGWGGLARRFGPKSRGCPPWLSSLQPLLRGAPEAQQLQGPRHRRPVPRPGVGLGGEWPRRGREPSVFEKNWAEKP